MAVTGRPSPWRLPHRKPERCRRWHTHSTPVQGKRNHTLGGCHVQATPGCFVVRQLCGRLGRIGPGPANAANAFQLLDPAESEQREVGAKFKVGQNSLAQIAYFDIERASTFQDPNTNVFGLNGKAQFSGFEMAWTGELNKQLSIAASALLMDAELQNADNAATFGKVPNNTPERTASLFAEYRLQDVPGLSLSGGLYYTGKRAVNDANQAFIGGYTVASLGARYSTVIGSTPTQFQLVVDNPTDKTTTAPQATA